MKLKKVASKRGILVLKNMVLGILAYMISKIRKSKEIWLIAERYNEARDNGYHLFRYIKENKQTNKVFYIIDKKAKDYVKIKKYDCVIQFGSFKHHIYYWRASKLISTHINGYEPNEKAYYYLNKILKNNAKKVFLQHGIIKDRLPQLFAESTDLDLFVCGAKPEYEYINEKYGYNRGIVKYLGLCRFDNLYNKMKKQKKQILIMPTFRMEYYIDKDEKLTKEKEERFLKSDFFNNYRALITSERLIRVCRENNIRIIFYPHYEMQKYIHLFKNISKEIIIADKESYDVQELLISSNILVTDFSSVFFDFAYMEKPIIYFQFDEVGYRKKHYKAGYFSYEKDGFGPVVNSKEKVEEELLKYIKRNFAVEEKYLERKKRFFEYNDNKNCERNYNAINML